MSTACSVAQCSSPAHCDGSGGRGDVGDATTVILAGVAVAAFASAAQTYIQQSNIDHVQRIFSWMLGSLNVSKWSTVATVALPVAVCLLVLACAHRQLDVITLGDAEAAALGANPRLIRGVLIATATLGTACVVAISGLIGFAGIVVPHALRLVVGPAHRLLMPLTIVWGAIFMLLADTAARTVLAPSELPVGVVTPVLHDVSLRLASSEWLTVVGPNGCGKSTLLNIVARVISPTTGEVSVAKLQARTTSPRRWAQHVALMPQRPVIPAGMTVKNYVELGFYAAGSVNRTLLQEVADTLDLSLKSEVARPSGGQAQRVVLALANLYSQRVALMDAGRIIAVGKDVLTVERVEKIYNAKVTACGPS